MEQALRSLSLSSESPTDASFELQVRLQLHAHNAVQIRSQQQLDQSQVETASYSVLSQVAAMQEPIQALRASVSSDIQQRGILIAHSHYVDLCISETITSADPLHQLATKSVPNGTITDGTTDNKQLLSIDRAICYWQSVRAIYAFTTTFVNLSPSDILGICFIQLEQIMRCIVVLNRLTTLENPAWDRGAVRAIVDMATLLDRMAEKFELVAAKTGEQDPEAVFTTLARMMRAFKLVGASRSGMTREEKDKPMEDVGWSQAHTHPQDFPAVEDEWLTQDLMELMGMTGSMESFGFPNDNVWPGEV